MIKHRGDKTTRIQNLTPHFMDRLTRLLIRRVANGSGEQPILIKMSQRRVVHLSV